jgi:restriction system protein
MSIPKHDEIRLPALHLLEQNATMQLREFELPLAKHFSLTEDEIQQEYESGNGKIFYDRISWALSYMNLAGILIKPKRGHYQLSDKGLSLLKTPDKIDGFINKTLAERDKLKKKNMAVKKESDIEQTPQEELYASATKYRGNVYDEIIEVILSKSPKEFEKLVVLLLQKMGYGGEVEDSGFVTKYSNDNGIDGIIKEDVLGLGRINVQAKRYARDNGVGREEIQKFVGALAVAQSNKGVFITTSYYSKGAAEYAKNLNSTTTLALIDGEKLAKFIYDYGLGMQTEQSIELKKLDNDFWDSMMDDQSK